MTSPAPSAPLASAPSGRSLNIGHWSLVIPVLACALLLGLSVFPPSSTRLQAWPWAFYSAVGWLLPIVVAFGRLAFNRSHARFGGALDAGFVTLVLVATASALLSPLRGAITPHLLPFLGACALPYALLPCLVPANATRTWRIGGVLLGGVLAISLLLWLQPWTVLTLPASRNAQPFGHANITGSVAVLATTWFVIGAVRETAHARVWFSFGATLAIITVLSSESRGAVLALAASGASAAAIILLRRGQCLLLLVIALLIAGGAVASNARLRELVTEGSWSAAASESNDQRITMLVGGLRLGTERPLLGWGVGSVPHVFPRVRADLPGTADNFLQLHNTPAQLWATLGAAGLLAALLIAAGLLARLRATSWTLERIAIFAGLVGVATLLLFDHPFATPAFAVLAAAHLAAWAALSPRAPKRELRECPPTSLARFGSLVLSPRSLVIPALGLALLAPALLATARDLAARSSHSSALDAVAANTPSDYASALRRALAHQPDDPFYAHLLAAHFATGHPFNSPASRDPQVAIDLLRVTLASNPDLEYAHYNLGWLLLDSDPAASALHFTHAARLAPHRGAVYWGLGLARIRVGDTHGATLAFATEWLLNPSFAWSPVWFEPPLDTLRPRILALAAEAMRAHRLEPWAALTAPAPVGPAYRRVRTGYGVLLGHPEGPPPIDVNIQHRLLLNDHTTPSPVSTPRFSGRELLDFLQTPSQ